MKICKFDHCSKKVVSNTKRVTIEDKLKQVYCPSCTYLEFHPDGTPRQVYLYGGIEKLWLMMQKFSFEFADTYKLKMLRDAEMLEIPLVYWNTRLHRSDKQNQSETYGTANLALRTIDVYIRRGKTPDRLLDTFIHEMVHFVAYEIFGQPLDILDGHTKVFWKFFFDFCNYIGFEIPLEV